MGGSPAAVAGAQAALLAKLLELTAQVKGSPGAWGRVSVPACLGRHTLIVATRAPPSCAGPCCPPPTPFPPRSSLPAADPKLTLLQNLGLPGINDARFFAARELISEHITRRALLPDGTAMCCTAKGACANAAARHARAGRAVPCLRLAKPCG